MENSKQPAYPHVSFTSDGEYTITDSRFGLTKREYFAGLAMQGQVASTGLSDIQWSTEIAKRCVLMADELLKQLEK